MAKRAYFPAGPQALAEQIKASPGAVSGGHVFLTGITGSRADGSMPQDLDEQVRGAFKKIGLVLTEAGPSFGARAMLSRYGLWPL